MKVHSRMPIDLAVRYKIDGKTNAERLQFQISQTALYPWLPRD